MENKVKPTVIVDSSFVLFTLTREGSLEFLSDCVYLRNLEEIRVIQPVYEEVRHFVYKNYNFDEIAKRGVRNLGETKGSRLGFTYREKVVNDILRVKAREISKRIIEPPKSPLSEVNCAFCAYSLVSSAKREVIAATKNEKIIKTIREMYEVTQKIPKEELNLNPVRIVKDMNELRTMLESYNQV